MAIRPLPTARWNGSAVVYEGPSRFTGEPVVVILTGLTGGSENPKTGPMVQSFILLRDVAPTTAVSEGADTAICGWCPRSGAAGGNCYVPAFRSPLTVWRAYQAGSYPRLSLDHAVAAVLNAALPLRIGAYGDPAAVPASLWTALTAVAPRWTGYTHAWRHPAAAELRGLVMASADSAEDAADAVALGWRYFRVRADGADAMLPGEITCPASDEAGHRTTCDRCALCSGTALAAKSVAILDHGPRARRSCAVSA